MLRVGMFIADRYEILGIVGSGGMSDVYKAKDHKLNRFVAIKVLKTEFSQDSGFVSKFRAEAQSAAGLSHPNVVNIYDVGEENGMHYIVMELVEGITLKRYIERKGKLSAKETISIAIQVAQGIEAAHANHIIHRDIKPQNIIISKTGKVKVADFGIARAASSNTINSNAMGSVHYISPEQARGGYIDERSDIYSLGITLFEMLTGELPFQGESTVTIALQHIQQDLPSLDDKVDGLPISLKKIIIKCTQKKPERRYAKVSSLIADLKHSLINPNEDFVVIAPLVDENVPTVLITDAELKDIKMGAGTVNAMTDELINLDDEDEDEEADEEAETADLDDEDDDDIDRINPKLEKIITIGSIIAAVVIVIIVILIFVKLFGGSSADKGGEDESTTSGVTLDSKHVIMPNLLGKEENEVADFLNKEYSLGATFKYENNAEYPKGQVCGQSVAEGEVVAKNTTITVTISEGGKRVTILDFTGYTYDELKKWGEDNGITINVTEWQISDTVEMNYVISWAPKAPVELSEGGTLDVIISRGSNDDTDVVVPSLGGKTRDEAESALKAAGLEIGFVDAEYNDDVKAGLVIEQNPDSGSRLPKGSSVSIILSKGPAAVKVPKVVGLPEEDALKALTEANLKGGVKEYLYDETVAEGLVIKQSTKEGTEVAPDTVIELYVSKGVPSYTYTATMAAISYEDLNIPTEKVTADDGTVREQPITSGTVYVSLILKLEDGSERIFRLVEGDAWTPEWTLAAQIKEGSSDVKPVDAYATVTVQSEDGSLQGNKDISVALSTGEL